MAQDQLQAFFQEKKQKAKSVNVDWGAKRDAWIKAVNDLYRTIVDEYLKDAKGDVEITSRDKEVREFSIGFTKSRNLFSASVTRRSSFRLRVQTSSAPGEN